jgi:hypothetical protein
VKTLPSEPQALLPDTRACIHKRQSMHRLARPQSILMRKLVKAVARAQIDP